MSFMAMASQLRGLPGRSYAAQISLGLQEREFTICKSNKNNVKQWKTNVSLIKLSIIALYYSLIRTDTIDAIAVHDSS